IALPNATKAATDFMCPDGHLSDLDRGILPRITDVLVIGWKGMEGHFLEEWRRSHAQNPDRKLRSFAVVDDIENHALEVQSRVTAAVGITPGATRLFQTFSTFVNDKVDGYV